ncbi:unnamed protein product [Triticum turgidum subsp. durum]|uniref:NPH3 domain-containing protein n=1 Tax=Triticum turgidum subsp. durum TaxID=4567 RepID=A0A9R1RTH4_TRITD|nr:unnamed protein product [Triticum turgidum subsp. durum]
MYKRLLFGMESRCIRPAIISGSLAYYAQKYILGLSRHSNMGTVPLAGTLSDVEEKNLLEEIDRLLPVQKGLVPMKFPLGVLS